MAVIGTFHHVHLICRDPDAAAKCYIATLGGTVKTRAESKGSANIRMNIEDALLSIRGFVRMTMLSRLLTLACWGFTISA